MDMKNINKTLPLNDMYKDALSPMMQQIGSALGSVTKTARFLIAPIEYLAAYQDRWQKYLKSIADRVPEENLIEGHQQIVIPVLEGLSLVDENSLLSELFVSLLANSIDKNQQHLAHPAFPNILKQLSHDEAIILFYLKKFDYKLIQDNLFDKTREKIISTEINEQQFPITKLQFPEYFIMYMRHLNSLGLGGSYKIAPDIILENDQGMQVGTKVILESRLDEFGKLFAKACVPDTWETL